jgi:hypothetical protein
MEAVVANAKRMSTISLPCLSALCLLTLGGCVDPGAHQDFIDPTIGDAVAANKAMQIADPWPRRSFDTRLPGNGGRAASSIEQYRTGTPVGGRASAAVGTQ